MVVRRWGTWGIAALVALAAAGAVAEPRIYRGELAFRTQDVAPVRATRLADRLVVQLGERDVACVDPAHQRILWRVTPGGVVERVVVRRGAVLVQADDLRSYAGDDGALRWVYPLTGQRLLALGPDAAVVAGFGVDPRQVAIVRLEDGAAAWPQWASVPGAASATMDAERVYVRTPDGAIVPVDRSTGRVREPVAEAPPEEAPTAFAASPVDGRLLVLGPEAAAWLPAGEAPGRIEADGDALVVTGAAGVRVMRPVPLGEAVSACRAQVAGGADACLAELAPLLGRMEGADPLVAPLLVEAALGTGDAPEPTPERLERVGRLLPELERVPAAARGRLVARVAGLVAPLVDRGRPDEAARLLTALEALAMEGPPALVELRFGVSSAAAVGLLAEARAAYKRRDADAAVAALDAIAALPRLAALLPPAIVDARDGRRELKAALDGVAAVLPAKPDRSANGPLCRGACSVAKEACEEGDRSCEARHAPCVGACP